MASAYLNFLGIVEDSKQSNPAASLGSIELQLLEHILLAHNKSHSLLVGDLISLSQIGSQATLHGRIKSLVSLGYLKLVQDQNDARKKLVVPTRLSDKYLDFMSECLVKAAKQGE